MMKNFGFSLLLVAMMILSAAVVAADVSIDYVRVNGERVDNMDNLRVSLGEDLDIRVRLNAGSDVDNVEVMARLVGFEYREAEGELIAIDGPFRLNDGDTMNVDLHLRFPVRGDKDEYQLRINVGDRTQDYDMMTVTLRVRDPRTALIIRDVIISPGGIIDSGRAALVQTRVENLGVRDIRDVLIRAEIPALGIQGSSFIDDRIRGQEVGRGDIRTSEEILLRIPPCAATGTYEMIITAEYDVHQRTTVTRPVQVRLSEACPTVDEPTTPTAPATVVPPQPQTLTIGVGGASFPVVITNQGANARTFTIAAQTLNEWGTAEIDRPALMVQPGETQTAYVFVSARPDAQPGTRQFTINVNDQSISATAHLVEAQGDAWAGLRRALEIGLIVLVILLIILALIVGFTRMRSGKDGEEGKTYY